MAADDLDFHVGLESLQQDMAGHQRRVGSEPTAEANRRLAVDTIQRIEREDAEAKPLPPPTVKPVEANHVADRHVGVERREGNHGRYLLSKSLVDDTKMRTASPPEHWFLTHAMPRAMLLMKKHDTGPLGQASWRSRTLAVMELHTRVSSLRLANRLYEARMLERRFMQEFLELLEASSAAFGDWKKDAPTRISVSG